jgi:putative DNA methylase
MEYKKKLIEVALPLEAINRESAREKSIRHGHPSTLHLWWSRKPLAAARAVLFASLVNDPSSDPNSFPTEVEQNRERERLFKIIEELVKWENLNNEEVLEAAKAEILRSSGGNPPPFLDPFAGGGSIPLEAQRLGLEAHASDLNPVAVFINKALIEIPPKFIDMPPVNPVTKAEIGFSKATWKGSTGLAEDIRFYGQWLRDEAYNRIGHLYPPVEIPQEYGTGEASVVAWIWARTVRCPNPACRCEMPLASKWLLSKKKGHEAWIEPIVDKVNKKIQYRVRTGKGAIPNPPKTSRGANFKCLVCGATVNDEYVKIEGLSKKVGSVLTAIIAEHGGERIFLSPSDKHINASKVNRPSNYPDGELQNDPRNIWCVAYGLQNFADLFTNRQLVALVTFSDLIKEAKQKVIDDCLSTGYDYKKAEEYANAICVYLASAVDRSATYWSSLTPWSGEFIIQTFGRQAIPMIWDYAEANPFSDATGNWSGAIDWICRVVKMNNSSTKAFSIQHDATRPFNLTQKLLVSTDPPYYDYINYGDLSDYFYIWLRKILKDIYPELFSTLMVPKSTELTAIPYRFGGDKQKAKDFFEDGLFKAFSNILEYADTRYPLTIYYAFKQTETDDESSISDSSGWETMLSGLIRSGYSIIGTWPMRTERPTGMKHDINALASSIILVCRKRDEDSSIATRREFINTLKRELKTALHKLQHGNIAPVDLAQSAIGPGMAVFSSYSKVLEADGTPMSVRTALQIINQELDAYLASQEGEMDSDTRFCVSWYEQFGINEAAFGEADVLARAKNTSVDRLVDDGVLFAAKGKVRLLKRDELEDNWDPIVYKKDMIWMYTQQLVKTLEAEGEEKTAALVTKMRNGASERAKDLAYRLYTIAERKGLTEEALAYNSLVVAWSDIQKKAAELSTRPYEQMDLF